MSNFLTFSRVTLGALCVVAILAVTFAAPQAQAAENICCQDLGEGELSVLDNGRFDVRWNMAVEHRAVVLTVSGPCGVIQRRYEKGETPRFSLEELGEDNPNGAYNWELRIEPVIDPAVMDQLAEVRGTAEEEEVFKALRRKGMLPQGPFVQSGYFNVVNGEIVDPASGEEKARLRAEMPENSSPGADLGVITAESVNRVTGEQVISGDLVVYNSICVGFDCPTNPSFGADTIRLQENNLRIHVDDTSTAASFPSTDWRLEFNSNVNGGGSYFRVIDASASRSIMTLEANAPSHSLYVDDGGRVGFGTASPVVELHTVDGDTPTLRLAQDTSSGFAAQTWDIAGNETSFFIRDATNGSTLPFRIRPGASSNSLVIDTDDDVGIGVLSPSEALHIRGTDGNTKFLVEEASGTTNGRQMFELRNNGGVNFILVDSSAGGDSWQILAETGGTFPGFSVSLQGSGTREFRIAPNGDVLVDGSVVHSSSRTVKDGFTELDPQEVLARVNELPITSWHYKDDGSSVRHIGPMAEDFYATFGLGTDERHIAVNDTAGVALAAIQGLHRQVTEKDARIAELEQRLSALEALLQADQAAADEH